MKAILCKKYGPPEVLQIEEVEKPIPKSNEVCVKIYATTVTVADFRIRSFTVPPSFWIPARLILGITKPRKPILGVELAGKIESVGSQVTRFKKGDHIFAATLGNFGAYAEYTCLPEGGAIAIKPKHATHEQAAAIPIGACTALHYLRKAAIRPGQKILIYGASGSVGTYAIQLARYFGAEITAVCSKANSALVTSLGADIVLDYTAPDFTQKLDTYDVILVAVDKLPFSICNRSLNKNGIYLNVTAPLKSLEMLWTSLTTNKKILVGENSPEKGEDLVFLAKLVDDGTLKPVIDRIYPFEQIVEAHRYVDKGHKKGNVAIRVSSEPVALTEERSFITLEN